MISHFHILVLVLATISLFLYGLRSFSDELRAKNSEQFKWRLSRITNNRYSGFALGTAFTAIVQSSAAVSSMTVALVDSGIVTFRNSLSVMLGSNLGTTLTAWLVSTELINIGPYFIVLGTIISLLPIRSHFYGKSIFYFGFILFSLDLIKGVLGGIDNDTWIMELLSHAHTPVLGLLIGIGASIVVQSSSLIIGLVILLAAQQSMDIYQAISIMLGCNIGTTSTALIAASRLSVAAKKSAIGNLIFNLAGLLVLPFTGLFASLVSFLDSDIKYQIAYAHLIFNVFTAILFLPFLNHLAGWIWKEKPESDLE